MVTTPIPAAPVDVSALAYAPPATPPVAPGEPPELVPFESDDELAGVHTPPAAAQRLRTELAKFKAFTPIPERRRDYREYIGAFTPQPNIKHDLVADTVDTSAALSVFAASLDFDDQYQPTPTRPQSAQGSHPRETSDELPLMLDPDVQPQAAEAVAAVSATPVAPKDSAAAAGAGSPGLLYPVYDDGKLVGYMAVPAAAPAAAAVPPPAAVAPPAVAAAASVAAAPEQVAFRAPSQQQQQQAALSTLSQVAAPYVPQAAAPSMSLPLADMSINHSHGHHHNRRHGKGDVHAQQAEDWSVDVTSLDIMSLRGKILDVARDHTGSRALQKRLDRGCTDVEKQLIFDEVEPKCSELMMHMFGNYVVQKLFEHGLPHHVRVLSEKLRGNVLVLTLSPYGCRVIQKALESVDQAHRDMVVEELTGQVPRCVQDQNGNHVIQKCIETMPGRVSFIVGAFRNNVQNLAMHAYGCRVIQRLLEFCKQAVEVTPIIEEVLSSVDQLVGDRYGNYVVQHVIINGEASHRYCFAWTCTHTRTHIHRAYIFGKLKGSTLALARGKFSSNVVEKMFEYGSHEERTAMLHEVR